MSPPRVVRIETFVHKETGLQMATSRDVAGFVVHAHDEDELEAKLTDALNSFMRATGHDVIYSEVERDEPAPGYGPPAFIARSVLAEVA